MLMAFSPPRAESRKKNLRQIIKKTLFPQLIFFLLKKPFNCFVSCFISSLMFSKAEINKAVGPEFNTRVAETKLGAKLLAKIMGLDHWRTVTKFKEVSAGMRPGASVIKITYVNYKLLFFPVPYSSLLLPSEGPYPY